MEPFVKGSTGTFPLCTLSDEKSIGVGLTGASAASRALLGLKALYALVDANRGKLVEHASATNGSTFLSRNSCSPLDSGRGGRMRLRKKAEAGKTNDHSKDGERGGGCLSLIVPPQKPRSSRVSAESLRAMPLMGHRYRYISNIGTGRFSNVVRAEDTFRPGRSVAVKVMNLDCDAIGIREVKFMRFLNAVPHSEFRPVLGLLDALTYNGHYCLVTELFDGTLSNQDGEGVPGLQESGGEGVAWVPATMPGSGGLEDGPLRRSASRLFDHGERNDRGASKMSNFRPRSGGRRRAAGRTGGSPAEVKAAAASSTSSSSFGSIHVGSSGAERRSEGEGSVESSAGGGCPTSVVRHVALQLVSALLLLRNHGLIHADIKPQNVLLRIEHWRDGGATAGKGDATCRRARLQDIMSGRACMGTSESVTVKLCDLGNAIHKSEAYLFYGDFEIQTLAYRAPEVLMGCPFGPAIDTWSVGVVLLELLLGRPLFDTARSRAGLLRQIVCAFGPMPLRRFRIGHYFSEYFSQDQSLKQLGTPKNSNMATYVGCCSCCWIGDRDSSVDGGAERHIKYPVFSNSCDGCCARRCRLPEKDSNESTPLSAGASRRRLGFLDSTGCSTWRNAHARLSRLIGATGSAPSTLGSSYGEAQQNEEAGSSSSGSTSNKQQDRRANARIYKPRPHRLEPSTSGIARQNPRLLSFLAGLLCYDPNERLTPLQALAHPFFGEALPFATSSQTTAAVNQTVELKIPAGQAKAPSVALPSLPSPAEATVSCSGARKPSCLLSSDNDDREQDPTEQLRRLADIAQEMVDEANDRCSHIQDGVAASAAAAGHVDGCSDAVGTSVAPSSPRQHSLLKAALLARLKHEGQFASTEISGRSTTPTRDQQEHHHQYQQQSNKSSLERPSATLVGARATTPTRQRRPNRFLTPATLALLKPDIGEREAAEAAAEWLGWGKRLKTSAATPPTKARIKPPSNRDRTASSPNGKTGPSSKTPELTTRRTGAKDNKPEMGEVGSGGGGMRGARDRTEDCAPSDQRGRSGTRKRKRPRQSTAEATDRPRARSVESNCQGATPSTTRGSGRATAPRRAAIAAGEALSRLRDDDESSSEWLVL